MADGTSVFIQNVSLDLQLIEKLNENQSTARIVAVLETDPANPEIATKVAVENTMAAEGASDKVKSFAQLLETMSTLSEEDRKQLVKSVVENLL